MSGSGSFTLSSSRSKASSRKVRRNRIPATPFASDDDHSWQGEVSWKFEAKGWLEYSTNLGSALNPWPASSASDHSRVFRQSANDYFLSRTSGFRGLTNSPYHERNSGYGRVELQSYVAADSDRSYCGQHSESRGFSKLGIIKDWGSGQDKTSPLAQEDELSRIDYSISDEPVGHDPELSYIKYDHGHYGKHYVGHGLPSHDNEFGGHSHGGYSHHDVDKISGYDEEGEENQDEEDAGPPKTVGLFSLFRYATKWDWVLVFVGCLGALINGGSLPWYSYLFGDLVNKISQESSNGGKAQMVKDVEKVRILPYSRLALY